MYKTLILFKIVFLGFNTLILASFSLVKSPLKLLFWYGAKQCHCISFNVLLVLKSYSFQFRKQEKNCTVLGMKGITFEQSYVSPKSSGQKGLRINTELSRFCVDTITSLYKLFNDVYLHFPFKIQRLSLNTFLCI